MYSPMRKTKAQWLAYFGCDEITFDACVGTLAQFPYEHQRVRTATLDSGEILIMRGDRRRMRRRIRDYILE